MTPEEAKDPLKGLAFDKEMKGQCKTFDVKQSASGLSMRCSAAIRRKCKMDITAAFTFVSAREYNGTVKSAVPLMGKTTTSDKRIVAKRIGECNK